MCWTGPRPAARSNFLVCTPGSGPAVALPASARVPVPLAGADARCATAGVGVLLRCLGGLEDLGLSQSDARTLSQTVLTELVENVAEHGSVGDRPAVALVGAILLSAETYALRQNGMHPHMAEVAERALADRSQVLRLIVADSGADSRAVWRGARASGDRCDHRPPSSGNHPECAGEPVGGGNR